MVDYRLVDSQATVDKKFTQFVSNSGGALLICKANKSLDAFELAEEYIQTRIFMGYVNSTDVVYDWQDWYYAHSAIDDGFKPAGRSAMRVLTGMVQAAMQYHIANTKHQELLKNIGE